MPPKTFLQFLLIGFLILFDSIRVFAQKEVKDHSVFLLSNIESLSADAQEFDAFEKLLDNEENEYTLLITGDFVDKNGFETDLKTEEIEKVDRLINLVKDKGRIIFVPGDLEWAHKEKKGWKKLIALEKYLKSKMGKGKVVLPRSACLGPEVLDIGEHLRIVTFNTQWFMEEDNRPEEEDGKCNSATNRELWDEIDDAFGDSENRNLIIAMHHPVLSFGQYAGYKLFSEHFKPPIYGSFNVAYRQNIGSSKDLSNEKFRVFRRRVLAKAELNPGMIFVTGHENDLQILLEEGNYHINSGGFAKSKATGRGKATLYRQRKTGFVKLVFFNNGKVAAQAFKIKNKTTIRETFKTTLFSSPCTTEENKIPVNTSFNPCKKEINTTLNPDHPKFGSSSAGVEYKAGFLTRMILGKNYRTTWSKQVNNIPYLDLEKTNGGLIPYAIGGGAQTISLKFKSGDGQRFAFRSINKRSASRLSKDLKVGIVGTIRQDLTTLHYPYGSLIVGSFMDVVGLPHSMPKLYLMPDHPILGSFRKEFAGKYGTFELKPAGKNKKRKAFKDADKVISTYQVYRKLMDDHDNKLDVGNFVTARIIDIYVGDWDRHEGNWKWLAYKGEDGGYTYKPFAKDRDKAFYTLNSLLRFRDFDFIQKDGGSFHKKYGNMKSHNFKARNMDRWMLVAYSHEDWMAEAKRIQSLFTDEVIDQAIATLPPEVQPLEGPNFKKKLRSRRDRLVKAIDKYYKMISEYVNIVGSNKRESFIVTRLKNGNVRVEIYKLSKKGIREDQLLDRVFKKGETKEIRLFGLGKRDEFKIIGDASKSILIRIISGDGIDVIEDNSTVSGLKKWTKVYDKRKKDKITLNSEAKVMRIPEIITFKTEEMFNYNYFHILPTAGYNQDDGFSIGARGKYTKQVFNKPDFGRSLNYNVSITTNRNFNVGVNLSVRHVVRKWDMIVGATMASNDKSFRQFYGLGNERVLDDDLKEIDFYKNNTQMQNMHFGLSRSFLQKSSFSSTIVFENREIIAVEEDASIYDELPRNGGLGKSSLLGPKLALILNFTDGGVLPKRGMKLRVENFTFGNSDADWKVGGQAKIEVTALMTKGVKIPATLSLKVGINNAYGETPFYYKSYLGQESNHRGLVRNRYGGNTAAYFNSDLRFHFGKVVTPLIPFEYGIYGLLDSGQVFVDGEKSNKLHTAYGGGIYIVPAIGGFNLNFFVVQSPEEGLLYNFKLGLSVK